MDEAVPDATSDVDADSAPIVKEGGTISLISSLFHLPLSRVCDRSRAADGEQKKFRLQPIDSAMFSLDDADSPMVWGRLSLTGEKLKFEPLANGPFRRATTIALLGYVDSSVVPHPRYTGCDPDGPQAMHMLMITHAPDPGAEMLSYFAGRHYELAHYEEWIKRIAAQLPSPRPIGRAVSHHTLPDVPLLGVTSAVFDDIRVIQANLPARVRGRPWQLVYQLSTHGCTYTALCGATARADAVVIGVLTTAGDRIGAFLPLGLRPSARYYGSGETFVFRTTPRVEVFRWAQDSDDGNSYFVATTMEDIAIGGGGAPAIWIGRNFVAGFSDTCPTFKSPQLTAQREFKIVDIEVWKVGPGRR
jgi:hypothetical protein